MQWLLTSKTNDVPMSGVDWIVLTANAVGVAVVVLASMQAHTSDHNYAAVAPSASIEVASLD